MDQPNPLIKNTGVVRWKAHPEYSDYLEKMYLMHRADMQMIHQAMSDKFKEQHFTFNGVKNQCYLLDMGNRFKFTRHVSAGRTRSIKSAITPKISRVLAEEAERRGMDTSKLCFLLLRAITEDNLFNSILEE